MKTKILISVPFLFYVSMFFVISSCEGSSTSSANQQQMIEIDFSKKNDLKDIIIAHLQNGDMDKLSSYFNQEISIGILGEDEEVSPKSAKILLKDFFSNNPVRNFEILHNGQSKNDNGQYLIGSLNIKAGKKYRVFVGFNKNKINQITIK